jgi:hypothetical protein
MPHATALPATTLIIAALTGCVSTRVSMIGPVRAPTSPDRVQVYLEPPQSTYQQIANVSASSGWSLTLTPGEKIEIVVERLKKEAAKLGANGILLYGVGSQALGSVGAGISTASDSGRSPYGLGFGTSALLFQKSGGGVAIYVDSH